MRKKINYCIVFVISSLIFTYFIFSLIENQKKEHLSNEEEVIRVTYNNLIESFKIHSSIVYSNSINTPEVKEILLDVNEATDEKKSIIREKLYKKFKDLYINMSGFKLKQLHFHLKNNESFLRFHRPQKYGDNLTDIRETVNYVNRYHKPISGFEEGRIFNGYRFVYPLSTQTQYLGSVETSISMQTIINALKQNTASNIDFIIKKDVVDKKVMKSEKKNYRQCLYFDEYYHEKSISPKLDPLIYKLITNYQDQENLHNKINNNENFSFFSKAGDNYYITTFFAVKHAISNDVVAYISVSTQHNELLKSQTEYLIFLAVLIFLCFVTTLFIYKINKDKEVLIQKDELLKEVQKIGRLGYWEFDISNNYFMLSDQTYILFGLSKKEFNNTYKNFLDFVHPEDRHRVDSIYTQSLQSKKTFNIKCKIITKMGKTRYVEGICHHIFDDDGNIHKSLGTLHDITTIKLYQQRMERSKEQFESLVSNMSNIVYRSQNNDLFTMLYINEYVVEITGYTVKELKYNKKVSYGSLIHPEDFKRVKKFIDNAVKHKIKHNVIEYRIIRKDNQIIWVNDAFEIIIKENPIIEGVISDITAQKESYNKLQKFIDTQKNIVILTNGKQIDFANKQFFDFFGYPDLKSFQKEYNCICELFHHDDEFFHLGKIDEDENWINFIGTLPKVNRIVKITNKDNEDCVFTITINSFEKDLLILSFTDISESYKEQNQLKQKVTHDKLTSAYNREYFEQSYQKLILETVNTNYSLGLAMIDIDFFKQVNDTYGHDVGDSVLIELVQEVNSFSRDEDILIRWGGEEFLFVIKVKSKEDLIKSLEHIQQNIGKHTFKHIGKLTCSIGGACYMENEDIYTTLKRADIALYEAKATGRNKVIVH